MGHRWCCSDKPNRFGNARSLAAFVDRFLTTLQLEPATVVGHSMGGTVALWMGIEHATHIERLVLVNVAEIGSPAAVFRFIGTPLVGDLLLRLTTPATMRVLLAQGYLHKRPLSSTMVGTYVRFLRSAGARQSLIAHARAYESDRALLLPRLGAISAPTLIVWTDRDPFFPLHLASDLQRQLPNADLTVIANSGHVPQEEQAETFSRAVLRWLMRSPAGGVAQYMNLAR